jgi:hypothetical protein
MPASDFNSTKERGRLVETLCQQLVPSFDGIVIVNPSTFQPAFQFILALELLIVIHRLELHFLLGEQGSLLSVAKFVLVPVYRLTVC